MVLLKWAIDASRGMLSFGRLVPRTGNTYEIQVSGREEGKSYTFYVMSNGGGEVLAESEPNGYGRYRISFTETELRKRFEKEWHEIRTFHTVVSDGYNVVAEGDLPIEWNPAWNDAGIGHEYTMRGPKGLGVDHLEYEGMDPQTKYMRYWLVYEDGRRDPIDIPPGQSVESVRFVEMQEDGTVYELVSQTGQSMGTFKAYHGKAATVAVGEVATLPEHSPATVENVGTEYDAIFKFGIPEGVMPKLGVGGVVSLGSRKTPTVDVTFEGDDKEFPLLHFGLTVGKSAYDVAVDNGFAGTQAEWLSSLIGGDYLAMQASVARAFAAAARSVQLAIEQQVAMDDLADYSDFSEHVILTQNQYGENVLATV